MERGYGMYGVPRPKGTPRVFPEPARRSLWARFRNWWSWEYALIALVCLCVAGCLFWTGGSATP